MPPDKSARALRRQRRLDAEAERMHDQLVRSPDALGAHPSTVGSTLWALAVVAIAVGAVLGLAYASTRASGWWEWLLVAMGWWCVWVFTPRPYHLDDDITLLDPTSAPQLHEVIRALAEHLGVAPPRLVGVNADLNAFVAGVGWRHRQALVLGLPLIAAHPGHRWLGIVGHELGHLRGRDTWSSTLQSVAMAIVVRAGYVLSPEDFSDQDPESWEGVGIARSLAGPVIWVLQQPVVAMYALGERLALRSSQHREYLADRRAAAFVGSVEMAKTMALNVDALAILTASAARRGEEPFTFITDYVSTQPVDIAALLADPAQRAASRDDTHPPDGLRVSALLAQRVLPDPTMVDPRHVAGAQAELESWQPTYSKALRDDLLHPRD